jgi:plasmid stability protein
MHNTSMPVTLTIKGVPDRVADALRVRAAASHRSLQGELMAILEDATTHAHGRRMTLAEAWERARRAGPPSRNESRVIVRKLRDERHGG